MAKAGPRKGGGELTLSQAERTRMHLPPAVALDMYRRMYTIRQFDEISRALIKRGEMIGEVHQYVGEEAVAVGVCSVLRSDDVVTSTHRGHGHIIAKGGDVRRMMAELAGKRTGYCKGKGGSMHIASVPLGILGANGIVGAGTPIAVGAAFAAAYQGRDSVAVAFFGDGASNQGVVHEAMNLASIYRLPAIFVCENNHYAVSFPMEQSTSAKHIADRAHGYGMPGVTVDGMDVLTVRRAAEEAVARARSGGGPSLIEADTYRFYGHFSAEESMLQTPYRTAEEIERWRQRDPVPQFRAWILDGGLATEADLATIEHEVAAAMDEAVRFMKDSPLPDPAAAYEDAYAVLEPTLPVKGWS